MITPASDNANAIDRVTQRLKDDVGFLLQACRDANKAPFWSLARTMFPVAESLAFLLYGGKPEGETGPRLSRFFREELGSRNPQYVPLASTICQIWRHGLTHGDEPPVIIVDAPKDETTGERDLSAARSMSWKLGIGIQNEHLSVKIFSPQSAQFAFCLLTFHEDLCKAVDDKAKWAALPDDEVRDRCNSWCSKFVDGSAPNSEKGKAAAEIKAFLP